MFDVQEKSCEQQGKIKRFDFFRNVFFCWISWNFVDFSSKIFKIKEWEIISCSRRPIWNHQRNGCLIINEDEMWQCWWQGLVGDLRLSSWEWHSWWYRIIHQHKSPIFVAPLFHLDYLSPTKMLLTNAIGLVHWRHDSWLTSSDSERSTNKNYKIKRFNLFRHLGNLLNPAGY